MVILLVDAYILNNGDEVGECVVEYVHSVSYVHEWVLGCKMFTSSGGGLGYLYPVEWFEYFVFNGYMMFLLHHEVVTCCWWSYHVHIGVVSRRIICFCMSPNCIWAWWFDVIGKFNNCDVVNLFVLMNNVKSNYLLFNYLKFNPTNIFSIAYVWLWLIWS